MVRRRFCLLQPFTPGQQGPETQGDPAEGRGIDEPQDRNTRADEFSEAIRGNP
jgi:hypothetical protein